MEVVQRLFTTSLLDKGKLVFQQLNKAGFFEEMFFTSLTCSLNYNILTELQEDLSMFQKQWNKN